MTTSDYLTELREYSRKARACSAFVDPPTALTDALDRLDPLIDAIEAVLRQAQGWIDEYGDPVYRGNGFADGVHAAAGAIQLTIETALRVPVKREVCRSCLHGISRDGGCTTPSVDGCECSTCGGAEAWGDDEDES